jgi:HAMP domain-containing protein
MRLPIRLRLTLVFTVSMAVLLAVTGSFVYLRLGAELRHSTDTALLTQADAIAAGLGQQGATFNPPAAGGLGTFAQVVGAGGTVLESSPGLAGHPAVPAASLASVRGPAYFSEAVRGITGTARIVVLPQGSGAQRVWVLAGTSSQNRDGVLSALLVLMVAGSLVTLAVAGAAGWAVAGAALRPVERMRQEADAISVSDRGRRLPIPASRDEIARLGHTVNAMLGRLEAAFERVRRRRQPRAAHPARHLEGRARPRPVAAADEHRAHGRGGQRVGGSRPAQFAGRDAAGVFADGERPDAAALRADGRGAVAG